MDPLRIHAYKIHAIKRHKRQQFLGTVLLYSLSALACTLFCSSPLWYPPFCATYNVIFFLFLPKICSFFFNSKVLFVVGNLIVLFLVGESKFFAPKSKASNANYGDICYDKYKRKRPETRVLSTPHAKKTCDVEKMVGTKCDKDMFMRCREDLRIVENFKVEDNLEGGEDVTLPAEELNKLADDFIARVNRQRRLEAEFPKS